MDIFSKLQVKKRSDLFFSSPGMWQLRPETYHLDTLEMMVCDVKEYAGWQHKGTPRLKTPPSNPVGYSSSDAGRIRHIWHKKEKSFEGEWTHKSGCKNPTICFRVSAYTVHKWQGSFGFCPSCLVGLISVAVSNLDVCRHEMVVCFWLLNHSSVGRLL